MTTGRSIGYSPRILLVEDLLIAQKIGAYALRACDCDVDIVSNGTDALTAVNKQPYDLIFMDLGLPDIDGLTVTETIRRTATNDQLSQIPIIALTAHIDEEIKKQSLRAGITDYLVKPLTDQLAYKILQLHIPEYRKSDIA